MTNHAWSEVIVSNANRLDDNCEADNSPQADVTGIFKRIVNTVGAN